MNPIKAYLLGIATVVGLAGGGVGIDSLTASTTIQSKINDVESKCVDGTVLSNIRLIGAQQLCAAAEKTKGLGEGDCTQENVKVMSITWDGTKTCATVNFEWDVESTLGTIQ